jgi:hypothetical protein
MTAEIGIGNQAGIVLAADSAVSETDYTGQVQAIYDSAQKLYTLDWQHYVGLMMYGNASFEGTPWSVLVQHYRQQVGSQRLSHLSDYQEAFLHYLVNEPLVNLPVTDQRSTVNRVVSSLTYTLCQDFQYQDRNSDEVALFIKQSLTNSAKNYAKAANHQLATNGYSEHQFITDYQQLLLTVDPAHPDREGLVVKMMKEQAQQVGLKLNGDNNYHNLFDEQLRGIWLHAIYIIIFAGLSTGQWKGNGESGIVIAGYGQDDDCPVVEQLHLYGSVGSHPVFKREKIDQIGHLNQVGVPIRNLFLPFAQTDVANTLRFGVSDDIYGQLTDTVMNKTDLPVDVKNQINQQLAEYFYNTYGAPFESEIAMLNIPELAEIAETMIKVTSFERQYNGDHFATVGGPIDVLAITPNDGPVWIQKKQYFDPNSRENLGWQLRLQHGM